MTPLDYGVPDAEEREALAGILAHAFAFPASDADGWYRNAGYENLRVVRRDREVVGGLLTIPMAQFLGGRSVGSLGLAGVGVRGDRRREGVASALVREVLHESRDRCFPLSALYASNQPLYRNAGYEQAGSRFLAEVESAVLRFDERSLPARHLGEADEEAVEALYRDFARHQQGALDRGPYVWRRVWRQRGGERNHALGFGDPLEAYVVYRQERRPGGEFPVLQVTDLAARTARGVRAVWTALLDLGTMARHIELETAPSDPFYLAHPHPWLKVRLHENWMVRVLDAERALTARGYVGSGAVTLAVDDPLDLCGGCWRLDVQDGEARVEPAREPEVRMHVRGLGAAITGFHHPRQLALAGLAEGEGEALDRLGALLSGGAPWMRDMF